MTSATTFAELAALQDAHPDHLQFVQDIRRSSAPAPQTPRRRRTRADARRAAIEESYDDE